MKPIFLALLTFLTISLSAQKKEYKIGAIGFYNFENLFDTLDAPDIRDEEFTPGGSRLWNTEIYQEKLDNLTQVVSEIGTDLTPDGLSILGVSEIENRSVLEDFAAHPNVVDRNYQIVHIDSPDRRGIDVALLYQEKYFKVQHVEARPVLIYQDNGDRRYTRDVLYVSGLYDGEPLHIMVNHWPSRSGGQAASQPNRNAAAQVCKEVCDSLTALDPAAKIIIMGDLNDDPSSPSVKEVLQAKRKKESVRQGGLYNPMYGYFKRGIGTLAWRDAWNLFDQIIVSYGLINGEMQGAQLYQTHIYNKDYLVQKEGQYQGYPHRTFSGNTYIGGYSDHFPVFLYLIKEK